MTRIVPILLACLLCATVRAESPIDVLVVGDVVVVAGVDWVAVPDAEPGDVELLLGVWVHDDLYPARNATVALRLARPLTLECYTVADDPADPQRERVTVTPELEPSRWQELTARLIAIETQLARLEGGPAPPPPPEVLRVDPNTATLDELVLLPGIGPTIAQRIIDAREHVVFRQPMDLAIVKGIGAATVEGLAEFLVFEAEPQEDPAEQEGEQTMATPYSDAVLTDAPVAYWKQNETSGTTMGDSSGRGHHGTYANVTLGDTPATKDDGDRSAAYNGTNSSGTVASHGDLQITGDMTIEFLALVEVLDAYAPIVSKGASNEYEVAVDSRSGSRALAWRSSSSGTTTQFDNFFLGYTGVWVHVAIVIEGTTAKAYRNAEHVGTIDIGSRSTSNNAVTIGRRSTGSFWFGGKLAHVALYDKALTAARIQAHVDAAGFDAPDPSEPLDPTGPHQAITLADEPVFHLSNATEFRWEDGTGNAFDGSVSPPTAPVVGPTNDGVSVAIAFNGSSSVVAVPPSNDYYGEAFTARGWVYFSHLNGNQTIFAKRESSGTSNSHLMLLLLESTTTLVFDFGNGSTARWNTGYTPPTEEWIFVAVTRNATHRRLFVNGVLVANTTNVGTVETNTAPLTFGRDSLSANNFFAGRMAEWAFYTKTLSESRLLEHYETAFEEPEPTTTYDMFRGRNFTARNFTASHLRSGY